jgi:hypothetical protein
VKVFAVIAVFRNFPTHCRGRLYRWRFLSCRRYRGCGRRYWGGENYTRLDNGAKVYRARIDSFIATRLNQDFISMITATIAPSCILALQWRTGIRRAWHQLGTTAEMSSERYPKIER